VVSREFCLRGHVFDLSTGKDLCLCSLVATAKCWLALSGVYGKEARPVTEEVSSHMLVKDTLSLIEIAHIK